MIIKPYSILIVEDEYLIARDIKNILNKEGYSYVMMVDSVDEAIEIIKECKPSLVLIDINLRKEKNGIFLGKWLLEKDQIPFIYISCLTDEFTIGNVNATRPYAFVVKPFKPIDLITTINIIINNYSYKRIDIVRNGMPIDNEVPFILRNVIRFIDDNLSRKIEVIDLTNLTKWKSQYFQRIFTRYMGMNPYQYILNKKMDRAKQILSETDVPIRNISFELGFQSHSNFCLNFKKVIEKTPKEYREFCKTKKYTQSINSQTNK